MKVGAIIAPPVFWGGGNLGGMCTKVPSVRRQVSGPEGKGGALPVEVRGAGRKVLQVRVQTETITTKTEP